MNPRLLEKIKEATSKTGEPDIILWTGDTNDHTLSDDLKDTIEPTKYATEFFLKTFPNTVLFPIHGNHEFRPANLQNMSLSEPDPIIETLSYAWKDWFTASVREEFADKSFYSYKANSHPMCREEGNPAIKDACSKLDKTRIIAWNAENCYLFNFYLLNEDNDPKNEIEWLEKTLQEMEENGEVAIIIGHISPGRPD